MTAQKIVSSMAEIEESKDTEYVKVDGFVAGQVLEIGSLTAGDFIEWNELRDVAGLATTQTERIAAKEAQRKGGLTMICKSLVSSDADGRKRYADDPKNVDVFYKKSRKVTERILEAIMKLNGVQMKGDKSVDAAKESAKND